MSQKKPTQTRRDRPFVAPTAEEIAEVLPRFVVFRETIESIVVAFVLAFLFRTFEAEAFVIPTGSMSPSLQGRHKDVICDQCGFRFRTSASSEDLEELGRHGQFDNFDDAEVVGGMCPMCRYPMPYTAKLPDQALAEVSQLTDVKTIDTRNSYPGDRILVNKYGYDFGDPNRWDVVVFKFPGDGDMNYIKRLVGLPGEELQLYQGDVFRRALGDPKAEFRIEKKPPDKVAATLQAVHDTDYESATLHKGGWPLRWAATTPNGWKVDAEAGEHTVRQNFSVDGAAGQPTAWLRYRHLVPHGTDNWIPAVAVAKSGSLAGIAAQEGVSEAQMAAAVKTSIRPELITDFNSYNARIHRQQLKAGQRWSDAMARYLGYNWVGDLAVEADVNVEEARGELAFDLVEAGYHFRATVDLKTGDATLSIVDGRTGQPLKFDDSAKTPITGPGKYNVRFANVDDQLLLWVDGKLVEFKFGVYDPDSLFPEKRAGMIPWASDDDAADQGDLAPAGIGATGAKVAISRLAVLRDTYYIATNETMPNDAMIMDYDSPAYSTRVNGKEIPGLSNARDMFSQREAWPRFLTRRHMEFEVKPGQLFVMGDNSPESADCRLWAGNGNSRGIPGGRYLDRRLLIGQAVCVFWPHSWGSIPGLPMLPGAPNFRDMRLVR
jgi:signal peptidase I